MNNRLTTKFYGNLSNAKYVQKETCFYFEILGTKI